MSTYIYICENARNRDLLARLTTNEPGHTRSGAKILMAQEALTPFLNLGIDAVNPVTLNPWFKLGACFFFGYKLYCYIFMVLDGTTG